MNTECFNDTITQTYNTIINNAINFYANSRFTVTSRTTQWY